MGKLNEKTQFRAEQVLKWIKRRRNGATFGEIQRYVVEEIHGLDYDEREPVKIRDEYLGTIVINPKGPRKWRGYYCDTLCGYGSSAGILEKFCELRNCKDGKRRYFVVKPLKRPFTRWTDEELIQRHRKQCTDPNCSYTPRRPYHN